MSLKISTTTWVYLGENAKIVHSTEFEIGIIKIQNNDQISLRTQQKSLVKKLEKMSITEPPVQEIISFLGRALKKEKLPKKLAVTM